MIRIKISIPYGMITYKLLLLTLIRVLGMGFFLVLRERLAERCLFCSAIHSRGVEHGIGWELYTPATRYLNSEWLEPAVPRSVDTG
jgi:hypothetical protein